MTNSLLPWRLLIIIIFSITGCVGTIDFANLWGMGHRHRIKGRNAESAVNFALFTLGEFVAYTDAPTSSPTTSPTFFVGCRRQCWSDFVVDKVGQYEQHVRRRRCCCKVRQERYSLSQYLEEHDVRLSRGWKEIDLFCSCQITCSNVTDSRCWIGTLRRWRLHFSLDRKFSIESCNGRRGRQLSPFADRPVP